MWRNGLVRHVVTIAANGQASSQDSSVRSKLDPQSAIWKKYGRLVKQNSADIRISRIIA